MPLTKQEIETGTETVYYNPKTDALQYHYEEWCIEAKGITVKESEWADYPEWVSQLIEKVKQSLKHNLD